MRILPLKEELWKLYLYIVWKLYRIQTVSQIIKKFSGNDLLECDRKKTNANETCFLNNLPKENRGILPNMAGFFLFSKSGLLFWIGLDNGGELHHQISAIGWYRVLRERTGVRWVEQIGGEMEHTKAVVFTHWGSVEKIWDRDPKEFEAVYSELIENYIKINIDAKIDPQIGDYIMPIVYVSLDLTTKDVINGIIGGNSSFIIDANKRRKEKDIIKKIQEIIKKKREGLKRSFASFYKINPIIFDEKPHFIFITADKLIGLYKALTFINNLTTKNIFELISGKGKFTYDVPKFVEAIIRLTRGNTPHIADHPILRLDEDVSLNHVAIKLLLDNYNVIKRKKRTFYFSGTYGRSDGVYDAINDYAVRIIHLTHVGVNEYLSQSPGTNRITEMGAIHQFLSELSNFGANQILFHDPRYGTTYGGFLPTNPKRKSTQLISGAGLIMSHFAISLVPPLCNFDMNASWVDDHIKRRLHETLGTIKKDDLECVYEAKIRQFRNEEPGNKKVLPGGEPSGLTDGDMRWTYDNYYENLISGILLHWLIAEDDGKATFYTEAIKGIIFKNAPHTVTSGSIKARLSSRYDEIITWWKSSHLHTANLADINAWATNPTSNRYKMAPTGTSYKDFLLNNIADNALDYLGLLQNWSLFVTSIEMMDMTKNKLLYLDPKNLEADLYDFYQNLCDPVEREICNQYFYVTDKSFSYRKAIDAIAEKMTMKTEDIEDCLKNQIFPKAIKFLNTKGYPMSIEIPDRQQGERQ